ncbi:MAG: phenylalanine--tRNA ligase subunit beta [Chlamydiales bacterium]
MKIPFSWLKEYFPDLPSPEEVAETLTLLGLEVEAIDTKEGESILEIALTPNLAHAASLQGVARELGAVWQKKPLFPKLSSVEEQEARIENETSVRVENSEACPRYACRLIKDVSVGPSPEWLKKRVEHCGVRSVNSIVDITNLVLLERGHPLHAFDFDKLEEKRIWLRHAKRGETLVTLDNKTHELSEEILLICDGKKPVAIAGVMGSLNTEVDDKTQSILLESAFFEPKQVRRSSKETGIQTEASYRFERGADPNGVLEALDRAASLICEIAGGKVLKGVIDTQKSPFPPVVTQCRLARLNQILGTKLSMSEVETIFRSLGLSIRSLKGDIIEASIPTYRHDIHHEIDLIEEAARLYGFNHIHQKKRASYRSGLLPHGWAFSFERTLRKILMGEGLQEFLTCDLISPSEAELITPHDLAHSLIPLLNPHSLDQSVLRPSLLPGLLSTVKHNIDHEIHSIAGFEVGRIHIKSKEKYQEPSVVSIILTGKVATPHWQTKPIDVDFFHLKGMVENLLEGLKIEKTQFVFSRHEHFHPGRQASIHINDLEIGIMGAVHPRILKKIGIAQPVFFAEMNIEDLKQAIKPKIEMTPLPLYPASSRDWTFTLHESYPMEDVFTLIEKRGSELLESVSLLDVYQSENLGCEWKNVTLRFIYRDREKTVSFQEIEKEHDRISSYVWNQLKKSSKVKEQP